jgi:hypothetical protein
VPQLAQNSFKQASLFSEEVWEVIRLTRSFLVPMGRSSASRMLCLSSRFLPDSLGNTSFHSLALLAVHANTSLDDFRHTILRLQGAYRDDAGRIPRRLRHSGPTTCPRNGLCSDKTAQCSSSTLPVSHAISANAAYAPLLNYGDDHMPNSSS